MTVRERLDEIRELKRQKDWIHASIQADELYERSTTDIDMTDDEFMELCLYLDVISSHIIL